MFLVVAAALVLQVEARDPKAALDGDALIFSFDLLARGAPAQVKSIDYTVFVEGAPLFSGTTPAFGSLGGFDARLSRAAIILVSGKEKFSYRVRGVMHGPGGDVPFSAAGECDTPE